MIWVTHVLLVLVPVMIYLFVIRPRLEARFSRTYEVLNAVWSRLPDWFHSFQTLIVGGVALALPEIILLANHLLAGDLSWAPENWQNGIRVAAIVIMILGRALQTTRGREPPSEEM